MKCLFCGTTRKAFQTTGRLGCGYCYDFLLSEQEIQKYKNASKQAFLKLYNLSPHFSNFKKSFRFLIREGFSIRVRYARNLKNFPFRVPNLLLDDFFEKSQKVFSSYFSFQTYHWKYSNDGLYLDLFDEDHFRLYLYPHSIQELIDFFEVIKELDAKDNFVFHEKYKYLTACPTNSFFGNKISIQLELNQVTRELIVKSDLFVLDKTSIDLKRNQKINFFLKNFEFLDFKKFLQFWENFIKSKTSNNEQGAAPLKI